MHKVNAIMDMLRIIAFRDGGQWVAQCLERDVCVQASDLDTLKARMERALAVEGRGGNLDRLPPAPSRFFDMWDKRSVFGQRENADGQPYELALCA